MEYHISKNKESRKTLDLTKKDLADVIKSKGKRRRRMGDHDDTAVDSIPAVKVNDWIGVPIGQATKVLLERLTEALEEGELDNFKLEFKNNTFTLTSDNYAEIIKI